MTKAEKDVNQFRNFVLERCNEKKEEEKKWKHRKQKQYNEKEG